MNKRCTNSSCRRTFSTLDFKGKCPFCGKEYPQLRRMRKRVKPVPRLRLGTLVIDFSDAFIKLNPVENKVKAIKCVRDTLKQRGYYMPLKAAKLLVDYYIENNAFPVWKWAFDPHEPAGEGYRNGGLILMKYRF